uniref:Dolichol-phosphate mannosyltransferase subunit 1 n=1 Tax=Paramoeba aestuarina TaxID=180227 RepID=A0A7S4NXC5_9EUKA|mmetsp:Transcript_30300/g.47015  ORF Transcript_30300/g.47015 Transcript_30300/m.47015 type:complete len:266 (+) Transcript_30300:38-835(+)
MEIEWSIVIPTYKEKDNLKELVTRVVRALAEEKKQSSTEIIIVDDNSQDGSVQVIESLQKEGYNVRIDVRTKERGLSSAVMHGFRQAKGVCLLCMDADLQHPPEKVPELLNAIDPKFSSQPAEFVIGTRYAGENSIDKDWPVYRRVLSGGARVLARPLTPLSDPMTGFFGLRKDVLGRATNVNTLGFKISLELYVKCNVTKHAEVPIIFGVRQYGYSKLSSKVIVHYLQHLRHLYWNTHPFLFVVLIALALFGVLGVLYFLFSLL